MNRELGSDTLAGRLFIGTVVANNDTAKRQRIKVTVPKVLDYDDGYTVESLPWCLPMNLPNFGTGDSTFGSVDVPAIGSTVWISFQMGKVDFPIYLGAAVMDDPPAILSTNYPNRMGRVFANGDYYYIDGQSGQFYLFHHSGTFVSIGNDGAISVSSPKNVSLQAGGDIVLNAGGDVNLVSGGFINLN
jgi:hypothetical protein